VLALERGRAGGAGALAAAGVTAKLFPAVFAPIAFGALAGRRGSPFGLGRPAVAFALAGAGSLLALNAPVALAAWDGFTWFFRFNAGRGAENSLWSALGLGPGPLLEALSTAPFALATLAAAGFAFRAARRGGDALDAVKIGTGLALVVWIATNKIWSPQYALYGFLAGALAAAPRPWFLVLTAMAIVDFHLAFEVRALRWDPWFLATFVRPGELVRSLLWLGFAGWLGVRLVRGRRA